MAGRRTCAWSRAAAGTLSLKKEGGTVAAARRAPRVGWAGSAAAGWV